MSEARHAREVLVPAGLLVLHAVLCLVLSFFAVGLVFVSDSCGSAGPCTEELIAAGFVLGIFGPWVPWLAVLVLVVVRIVRRRPAWWVPLAGAAGSVAVFGVAVALAFAGAA